MNSFEVVSNAGALHDERYASKEELAGILSVSVRTIEKNSNRIAGRVKIGRSVRFYLPDVHRVLLSGRNLFGKK
jgi:hypothetical protein